MATPVEFSLALSNSFPSGTGSYNYNGSFKIVVQNLAYQKQVSIWARIGSGWSNIPASYVQSLPGNLELWTAPASNGESAFAARYGVNGAAYWDSNGGSNYVFPQAFDEFAVLAGNNYKVVLGNANLSGTTLHVSVAVQNLAYAKVVGLVFTTDNWATAQTAYGGYNWKMKTGLEVWQINATVGSVSEVKFALFYRVLGNEYWDNNFWRNYRITPGNPQQWGDAP